MSVIWAKVRHDLWHHRARSSLAVASIAVGVFAVGAVFGMVDQLLAGMDEAHRAVVPSHINIILRGAIDEAGLEKISAVPGVEGMEPAGQMSIRYRTDETEEPRQGFVSMRRGYEEQKYDLFDLDEGEWPGAGKIGIERLSSHHFGPGIGDEVIIEIGGEERSFEISGLLRHPFVQPPAFGGHAHFFVDQETFELFGTAEGYFSQVMARIDGGYDPDRARKIAAEMRRRLALQGIDIAVVLHQDPDRHWGRLFGDGVTLVLRIMAVVSLGLSVLLVLITATAAITQQTDQIGVLKALGARRRTIVAVYLSGVLVMGALAFVLALPLAVMGASFATGWFLAIFNVDHELFSYSALAISLQIGAAIVAPALAAIYPVLKGASMTVREALSTYGVGADFGGSRLDRFVESMASRLLPTVYAAALGNMLRKKERLSLTLMVMTVAGAMFLIVMSLVSSINYTLDEEMGRRGYDIDVGLAADRNAGDLIDVAYSIPDLEDVEVWLGRNVEISHAGEIVHGSGGLGSTLLGLPVDSVMRSPQILEGSWLTDPQSREIVMPQSMAESVGVSPGDLLELDLGFYGQGEWTVAGTYREIQTSGYFMDIVFAPIDSVREAEGAGELGTKILARLKRPSENEAAAVASDLVRRLEEQGIEVHLHTTSIKSEEREHLQSQFDSVILMLLGLAMMVALVGGIGLAGSLAISVIERRREVGVLRAIGADSKTITRLFVAEGVFQSLTGWLLALPISLLLAPGLSGLLGRTMLGVDLDYRYAWPAVWFWLLIALAIGAVASFGPARGAAAARVRESLSYS